MSTALTKTEIKKSRIIVTGGCGFIGSHLVKELLKREAAHVCVVDSLRYGKKENLEGALDSVEIVPFTLGQDPIIQLKDELRRTDLLFHLAAEKHNQSKDTPANVFRANIAGTYDLYSLAAECGVKKLLFTSSLYSYGQMSAPAMNEHDLPQPWTVYGISKLAGEHLLNHVAKRFGVSIATLRYFFVYGPRQFAGLGYKSVIVKNFERIARGEAPVIFGDGKQVLDYVYVDDAVDATCAAMESEADGAVFNVASSVALSVKELTRLMLEVAGSNLEPVYAAADWTAGTYRVGTNDAIGERVGWQPRVDIKEGLWRTYEWIKAKGSTGRSSDEL